MILTSNNTRDLSAALKRRCLHLSLDYPAADRELEIIKSKNTGLSDALAAKLVQIVRGLRTWICVRPRAFRRPSTGGAHPRGARRRRARCGNPFADSKCGGQVRSGPARAVDALPRLVDPNAQVPSHLHTHDHGHGHPTITAIPMITVTPRRGHSHDHDHNEPGREKRASKDEPGRHGDDYYGAPGDSSDIGKRTVSAGQGSWSFASRGGGARKRPF